MQALYWPVGDEMKNRLLFEHYLAALKERIYDYFTKILGILQ